jgi:hypothetical protein
MPPYEQNNPALVTPHPLRDSPSPGGVPTTGYTAQNNLRNRQINPVASDPTRQAVGFTTRGLNDLYNTPDRGQIAQSTFQRLRSSTEPDFQADLRDVGRNAATFGRLGAGMTTSRLGDVATNRERFLTEESGRLSDEAASRTLDDRLGRFGASAGATQLFEGMDRGRRDELRGERGFQNQMQQQSFQEMMQQRALEEMLLQGEFGRNQDWTQMLLGAGYGG